jgi:hypothetical protein
VTVSLHQQLVERFRVGQLGDQAAIVQILKQGGLVHCDFSTHPLSKSGIPLFPLICKTACKTFQISGVISVQKLPPWVV